MQECVFCRIIGKELESNIQYEDDLVIAFDSIDPAAQHHVLIVPKVHIPTASEVKADHKDILFRMLVAAQELIIKLNTEEGYKLIFNGGKYPAVKHLHWHLLGGKILENYQDKI